MPSASAATWRVCATSRWYWPARFRTLARRTSSNSGSAPGDPPVSKRSKKTPSRSPASVVSRPSKPPACSTPWTTSAPARIRSARAGLMPGHTGALGGRQRGQALDQLRRAPRARSPCPARRWTAGRPRAGRRPRGCARCRRSRPGACPARRRPPRPPKPGRACCKLRRRRARAAPPAGLRLAGPLGGRKRSLIRTVPSRQEPELAREAIRDTHELHRAAAEVEHEAVARASSS